MKARPSRLGLLPHPYTQLTGSLIPQHSGIAAHLPLTLCRNAGDGLGTGQIRPLQSLQLQGAAATDHVAAADMATDAVGFEQMATGLQIGL